jgi:two-component system, OmpR family, phosphate regulon response regulator PhoB
MEHQKLILIVEDEPDAARLLEYQFQERGYRTLVGADGPRALRLVFEHQPDLVILDLLLPELHGLAVCSIMKLSPRTRQIPVLVLTCLPAEEKKAISLRSGARDYLTKPVSIAVLIQHVELLLAA